MDDRASKAVGMINPTHCYLIHPDKVADIPIGCPVESDTAINVREVDGTRIADPYTPGDHYFSGPFLRVGYIRVGPAGKRKAVKVARIWDQRWGRVLAVPIDGVRIRLADAGKHCEDVAARAGLTGGWWLQ